MCCIARGNWKFIPAVGRYLNACDGEATKGQLWFECFTHGGKSRKQMIRYEKSVGMFELLPVTK